MDERLLRVKEVWFNDGNVTTVLLVTDFNLNVYSTLKDSKE